MSWKCFPSFADDKSCCCYSSAQTEEQKLWIPWIPFVPAVPQFWFTLHTIIEFMNSSRMIMQKRFSSMAVKKWQVKTSTWWAAWSQRPMHKTFSYSPGCEKGLQHNKAGTNDITLNPQQDTIEILERNQIYRINDEINDRPLLLCQRTLLENKWIGKQHNFILCMMVLTINLQFHDINEEKLRYRNDSANVIKAKIQNSIYFITRQTSWQQQVKGIRNELAFSSFLNLSC